MALAHPFGSARSQKFENYLRTPRHLSAKKHKTINQRPENTRITHRSRRAGGRIYRSVQAFAKSYPDIFPVNHVYFVRKQQFKWLYAKPYCLENLSEPGTGMERTLLFKAKILTA